MFVCVLEGGGGGTSVCVHKSVDWLVFLYLRSHTKDYSLFNRDLKRNCLDPLEFCEKALNN